MNHSVAIAAFSNVFAPELWTESQLAQRLGVDAMRLSRCFRSGQLRPDFISPPLRRFYLPRRISELRAALTQPKP